MSPPASSFDPDTPRGVLVPKPRTTIYVVLLGLTVLALFIGCALLGLELWRYPSLSPPANLR